MEGPRPQPDYSVGFRISAATNEQLKMVDLLIGSVWELSFLVATCRIYFPFFACRVNGGAAALDVADRQNAYSMTVAVKRVVELDQYQLPRYHNRKYRETWLSKVYTIQG